ncbi:MAG: MraY family glycosyltransferase [Halomonas sp.]|nr:MraY family glycosyltransferase [Halomonas sp.]
MGLADRPGGRKQHQGVIPLTGGLGVFIGFMLVQPFLPGTQGQLLPLFAGMALLVACGVIDDACDMRSTVKLGVQLVAAVLMVVWGHQVVRYLGEYPGIGVAQLGWLAIPITVVAVAGLVNAVNMMDGIDGLAGSTVLAMLVWLGFVAALQGQFSLLAVIASLAAAVMGFLLFNLRHPWRKRASVFMGDAGSMALGFAIAWFVIELSQQDGRKISPVAYGWVLALPVMDTLSLMLRRLRKGRSPFAADREHLHHIFLRAGFSPGAAASALMLIAFGLGAIGVFGSLAGVPDILLLVALVSLAIVHDIFIRHAWRTSKALRRLLETPRGPAILVRAHSQGVMLRTRPIVDGWRRNLAIVGLYLGVFTLTLDSSASAIGAGLILLATLCALPYFLRDAWRLPLFWVVVVVALYLTGRSLEAGASRFVSTDWRSLVLITGIVSLPIGWWLAQLRLHWPGLLCVLLAGAVASFVAQADWLQLEAGVFANPTAWGPPAQTGFLASVGLMFLLAMLFSGLQRLGNGWRPAYLVGGTMLMCIPVIVVLVATRYSTGWIGTLAGLVGFSGCILLFKRHASGQFGLVGLLALMLLCLIGLWTWQGLLRHEPSLVEGLLHPLQAIVYVLQGEAKMAHVLHPGSTERLMLWTQAWETWQANPLFGSGNLAPEGFEDWLAGYQGYYSLYASIAAGFGVVGLVGFLVLTVVSLRLVILAALEGIWPISWTLGLFSACMATVAMFLLAEPIRDSGVLAMVVLLMAGCCAAAFHRLWISMRGSDDQLEAGAS